MRTLYTLPSLPLHFVLKDDDNRYWIMPATTTGQPRTPFTGYITQLERVSPQISRVLLASWSASDARISDEGEKRVAAYQKRLVWAAQLLKDVMATLGSDAGIVWWRNHRAALKQNLAAVQREWNDEKRALRPKKGVSDGN